MAVSYTDNTGYHQLQCLWPGINYHTKYLPLPKHGNSIRETIRPQPNQRLHHFGWFNIS